MLDLLVLEDDVCQRCLSAQPDTIALLRSNWCKCAHLLRDLAATADLPPHCALFSEQPLDLTQRWWSETEGTDIEEGDVHPLAAAAQICNKLHSARHPDLAPFQLPDPRQRPRSLTGITTAPAATLGRRQPHNVPPLHTAQVVHEVVSEEYRILESVNYELVTNTPADCVRLFETRFSLNVEHLRERFPQGTARVPSEVLASTALLLARNFVRDRSLSM